MSPNYQHGFAWVRGGLTLAAACVLCLPGRSAALSETASNAADSAQTAISTIIDRLPDLMDLGLPGFAPQGSVYFYAHPKFGDLLHEDYFRLPVGARIKVQEHLELHAELDGYFTHGLRDSVGNGLYEGSIGVKQEADLPHAVGASVGIDFTTPLSRPPVGITDGLRHTVPYLTLTRTIVPDMEMLGFVTFGADLLDHTAITPDFVKNELEANSLTLTAGVARPWRHLNMILKLTEGTTALTSHLHQNAFGIRPSVGVPFLRRPDGTPRATITFEGRTVWGPGGFEVGVTTSVRLDLRYRHNRSP